MGVEFQGLSVAEERRNSSTEKIKGRVRDRPDPTELVYGYMGLGRYLSSKYFYTWMVKII